MNPNEGSNNKDFLEKFAQLVFKIITKDGSGSGFYYNEYKIIITNYHVVKGHRIVGIEDINNNSFSADVLVINPALDIALLKPKKDILLNYKIDFIESIQTKAGEKVKVLGYPYGMPFTITEGIISSTNQIVSERSFIQTDAAVNPGNSGGPIIDEKGRVIGITTLKLTEAENIAFAIPTEYIKQDLEDLIKNPSITYTVKCPSCLFMLQKPYEFCPNCGTELKNFHEHFRLPKKSELEKFIEEILSNLDIDPIAAQKGKEFWEFYFGSSLIRFFLYREEYYFLTSPLVKLPKINMDKFYEFILSNPHPPYILGILNNKLYLSYRIHKGDFKETNYKKINNAIMNFIPLSDKLDDFYIKNFGCEYVEESKRFIK
ncbi:MAG: trypsin-like peptidase domain-containing protein [Leptonema sp. (in: bacteria)]